MNENWTEVVIEIPASNLDIASAIATMVVPYGIYIEDYTHLEEEAMEIAHIDLIDELLLKKDRTKAWIHLYISPDENPAEAMAFLRDRLSAEKIPFTFEIKSCAQEDWMNNWKKYFKPMPVGDRLLIRPIWEDKYDDMGRVVLHLEPGVAFGTGTHETTRLCLQLLERYLPEKESVLDIGCGSGILSVAALLLGAKHATGVDIDQLAVKTAEENARRNQVEDRFDAICGNLTEKVSGKFDLALANIVADVILELTPIIPHFLTQNAVYIISGIIETREQEVLAMVSERFNILERYEEKGWVAMALTQKIFE